jgi:hypothetical protein
LNTGPSTGAAALFFALSEAAPEFTAAFFSVPPLLAAFVPELEPAALLVAALLAVTAVAVLPALALASVLAPASAAGAGALSTPLSALAFLSVVAQPFRKNPKSRINRVEYLEERVMFKFNG